MRPLVLLLIIALALSACAQVTAPEPEKIAEETAVVEEPAWQPEPWHIYILDAADAIQFDYEAATLDDYRYMLQAVKLKVELHNRDYPLDLWHWVEGGVQ